MQLLRYLLLVASLCTPVITVKAVVTRGQKKATADIENFSIKPRRTLPASVLLLNDTSAHYHWGCTGTSIQLKTMIMRDYGFPQLNSVPIFANNNIVNVPVDASDYDNNVCFELFKETNPALFFKLEEADIIIINGEGTLHDIGTEPEPLLYIAYVAKKFLPNKQVQIINHSFFPWDNAAPNLADNTAKLCQKVYRVLDFIAVRESFSLEILEHLGINNATLSFDCLPLYIKENYLPKKHRPSSQKTILFSGRCDWNPESVDTLIRYMKIMREKGYHSKILVGARHNAANDDRELVAYLHDHYPQGWSLVHAHSLDEWLTAIDQASLLVSGRFHHSIAAACLNTPFICLEGNTPKVHAIAHDIDALEVISDTDPDLLQKLNKQTKVLLKRKKRKTTHEPLKSLCKQSIKNFDGLKNTGYPMWS